MIALTIPQLPNANNDYISISRFLVVNTTFVTFTFLLPDKYTLETPIKMWGLYKQQIYSDHSCVRI